MRVSGRWRREQPGVRHCGDKIQMIQERPRAKRGNSGKGDRRKRGEAVELQQVLCRIHEGRLDLRLVAYQSYGGWKAWTRDQEIHCLRRRLSIAAKAREKRGGGEKARLVPEEFAPHSGRIGVEARLAVIYIFNTDTSSIQLNLYYVLTPSSLSLASATTDNPWRKQWVSWHLAIPANLRGYGMP